MKLYIYSKKLFLIFKLSINLFLKILITPKKNIIFLDGGFGVISTHCYSIPFLYKRENTLVFWLIKKEFNPIEMIDLWKSNLDLTPIDLNKINGYFFNLRVKEILFFILKKIIKLRNKNFIDIWQFDINFVKKFGIKEYENLEKKNKGYDNIFNFHNEKNLKKYKITRSPYLAQIVKGDKSKKAILRYDSKIYKSYLPLKKNNYFKYYMLYIRGRKITSLEGNSRNGSNLSDYIPSIKYLKNKKYIPLINGDYQKKDIRKLKKEKISFYEYKTLNLSRVLFYQLSTIITDFVISEYGGGTCFPFTQKKKMLLLNVFPISHGYGNSLIFPKIFNKKDNKILNLKKLFEKKAFIEYFEKDEFRKLNDKEILLATKEFINNFFQKNKTRKDKISRMNCNFSNYLKITKYSYNYLKIQNRLFKNIQK